MMAKLEARKREDTKATVPSAHKRSRFAILGLGFATHMTRLARRERSPFMMSPWRIPA